MHMKNKFNMYATSAQISEQHMAQPDFLRDTTYKGDLVGSMNSNPISNLSHQLFDWIIPYAVPIQPDLRKYVTAGNIGAS